MVLDHIFGVYANNFPDTISFITCLDPYLQRRFGVRALYCWEYTKQYLLGAHIYFTRLSNQRAVRIYTYAERRYSICPRFYLQAPGGINKNKIKTMWLKRRDLKLLLVMALLSLQGFHIFSFFYCVFVYRHKACESSLLVFLGKKCEKLIINLRFRNLQSVLIMFSFETRKFTSRRNKGDE